MCGIVGYVGDEECASLLVDGLRKLEYRGYDSAGLAVLGKGGLSVIRAKGKLQNLETRLKDTAPTRVLGALLGLVRLTKHVIEMRLYHLSQFGEMGEAAFAMEKQPA